MNDKRTAALARLARSRDRRAVVEEWARDMAKLAEGPDAGWGIYYDWLHAFLGAVERDDLSRHHPVKAAVEEPQPDSPASASRNDRDRDAHIAALGALDSVVPWEARCHGETLVQRIEYVKAKLAASASREVSEEPWKGHWNNWIAPFHACPRCNKSLDWKRGEDVFDNPFISATCCGLSFSGRLAWDFVASGGTTP